VFDVIWIIQTLGANLEFLEKEMELVFLKA
jgi:hypothetical protein